MPLIKTVEAKTIIAVLYFSTPNALPPIVEVIIDGNLANVTNKTKLDIFTSVRPAK